MLSIVSCEGNTQKNKDVVVDNTSIIDVKKIDNVQSYLKPKDLILEFYTKYITYLEDPLNEESVDYEMYLTEDLIKEIGKNWGYDYIIKAQDSSIEWLKTLKVEDTEKDNVYSVSRERGYYDSDDNTIYVTVKQEKDKFKISKLSRTLNEQSDSFSAEKEDQDDEFTYYLFKYRTKPDNPRTALIYRIEYIDNDIVVINMDSHNDSFEYELLQKKSQNDVELYYKKNTGIKEYTGDISKPLMRIYKKGDDFYAISPLIEDGKEVKLKEEE